MTGSSISLVMPNLWEGEQGKGPFPVANWDQRPHHHSGVAWWLLSPSPPQPSPSQGLLPGGERQDEAVGLRASSRALLGSGLPMVVVPAAPGAGGPCLPAPSPGQPQGKGQDAGCSRLQRARHQQDPICNHVSSSAPEVGAPRKPQPNPSHAGSWRGQRGQTFPLFPAPMGAEAQPSPVPPSGRLFRDGKHQGVLGVNPAAQPKPSQLPAWDMQSGSAHASIGLSGNLLKSHLPTRHTTEKVISSKEVLRAPHLFLSR